LSGLPSRPAIRLAGVTLALGGRTVLADIDVTIVHGEFIGLLGANGAGKTTLLRAILGLVPSRAGRIEVLGAAARRGAQSVGYMPQSRAAIGGRICGRDFVAAAVKGQRWGLPLLDASGRRDVDRALDLVGATALARRPLTDLSGGERQRLLLAQALLGQPRLLLLDEPLMSLDPHRQAAVVDLVRGLQRDLGLTVLFSAHELNPLLEAMDRVLYLGGGHAAIGTVDEVITGPVLSRLYGSQIEVVRLGGRIFVMSGQHEMERDEHRHHDHHHHGEAAHPPHV
jgi:zinc/manganese transport system ATP-binding protein